MRTLPPLPAAMLGAVGGAMTMVSAYGSARFPLRGRAAVTMLAAGGGAALAVVGTHWHTLSITDNATGLYNRRYLFSRLHKELSRARRKGEPLGFVVAEIDNMRQYNNTYGHLVGDAVLLAVAQALRGGVRRDDIVGRWGGDEFGIILPKADLEASLVVAERVRSIVGQLAVATGDGRTVGVTISAGVTDSTQHTVSLRELVDRADKAMYVAKERKDLVMAAV